jgi:hypothetical protein
MKRRINTSGSRTSTVGKFERVVDIDFPVEGVRIAVILENGAPVEFAEFEKKRWSKNQILTRNIRQPPGLNKKTM